MTKIKGIICFMALFLGACTSLKYASIVKSASASSNTERKLASYIHPKYEKWCAKQWERNTIHLTTNQKYVENMNRNRLDYINHSCKTEPFKEQCREIINKIIINRSFASLHKSLTEPIFDYYEEVCPVLFDYTSDYCAKKDAHTQRCDGCQEIDPEKITDPVCCEAHGYFSIPITNFQDPSTPEQCVRK